MTVRFVARKCDQCAGRLQYIREKKIWKCLYCGAEIERQEQYSALFTIKNVVRQSLLDSAYRRLESAADNLLECKKIDSHYIGTLIAGLTYDIIRVTTPGACEPREVSPILTQVAKNYKQLKAFSTTVTEEEEALYEFLEESDILATLVLVYDSLGDAIRRDFVTQMIDAREIFSIPVNTNLLRYAIKNELIDLADQIIANVNNIDVKTALIEVMEKYPDNGSKGDRITTLLSTNELKYEDRRLIETYLSKSPDTVSTKSKVASAAINQGLLVNLDVLMDHVIRQADVAIVQEALSAFCKTKISDEDVVKILSFAYECGNIESAKVALDCLKDSEQYVLIPTKLLISMLSDSKINQSDKIALLDKSFEFRIDDKSFEALLKHYLCFNDDSTEKRKPIVDYLLERAVTISSATVNTYVLQTSIDGENKPSIVEKIFSKELILSFFNDLLSDYMASDTDTSEVKTAIVEILSQKGLKVSPGDLIEYICDSPDDLPTKIRFIQKMVANGSQLRADAASTYLERMTPDSFSSELFSLIFTPVSLFSLRAAENYLLWIKDNETVKGANVKSILDRCTGDIASVRCHVSHLGNTVTCNMLQAYTLVTTDSQTTALEVANFLISGKKLKLNDVVQVSGSNMRLKKYVMANSVSLSTATNAICEQYRMFSLFF
jgi:hypothetical protein